MSRKQYGRQRQRQRQKEKEKENDDGYGYGYEYDYGDKDPETEWILVRVSFWCDDYQCKWQWDEHEFIRRKRKNQYQWDQSEQCPECQLDTLQSKYRDFPAVKVQSFFNCQCCGFKWTSTDNCDGYDSLVAKEGKGKYYGQSHVCPECGEYSNPSNWRRLFVPGAKWVKRQCRYCWEYQRPCLCTVYPNADDVRYYGFFKCISEECGNEWNSSWAWMKEHSVYRWYCYGQDCAKDECGEWSLPSHIRPLVPTMCNICKKLPWQCECDDKNHRQDLCHKCMYLPFPCSNRKRNDENENENGDDDGYPLNYSG